MTLQKFAYEYCDGLYTPGLQEEYQCSGWHTLRKMVAEGIEPDEENMAVFHMNLRPLLIEYWQQIKKLPIQPECLIFVGMGTIIEDVVM